MLIVTARAEAEGSTAAPPTIPCWTSEEGLADQLLQPALFVQSVSRAKLDQYSTEVFDKHNIADALIGLRKQNPSAIRRDSQSGRSMERVFL